MVGSHDNGCVEDRLEVAELLLPCPAVLSNLPDLPAGRVVSAMPGQLLHPGMCHATLTIILRRA
jgi:hypothetical protein